MRNYSWQDAAKTALLAGAYFVAGTLGLSLAAQHENVSLVWPPTGIALAGLLLIGYRAWPGVFLGAFLVNILTHVGLGTTLGISAGNTLEALAGAVILRRFVDFRPSLERLKDVLGLVFGSAVLSTAISATIGVTSLCLGHSAPWSLFGTLWSEWWVGDMLGALIVAPFLLTWSRAPRLTGQGMKILEAFALSVALILAGQFSPYLYPIFPALVWAALRFGPRGATMATLTVSGMAVWGVVSGSAPFAGKTLGETLLFLQLFMAVVVLTTLTLAAVTTERKKAEEDLKKANEDLIRLSEIKSEFASMVSHELRTPLSSIKEGIEIVLDGTEGEINALQRQCLDIAKHNVDRLARLIDNVLDYSKVESGKLQFALEKTDVKTLIQEVHALMKFSIHNKHIDFKLRLPSEEVIAICDNDKIRQVVINLLDNAMKYTEPRGRIELRLERAAPDFRITVEDNGVGIKKEDQEKIFEMFGQAPVFQGKRKRHGFGLGLAICKLIVERHGGRIFVESSPGKGSRFTVLIPERPADDAPKSSADVVVDHRQQ